ncbi:MAG: hypothetical protein ACI8UO_003522 [Verrucomicrobiales bacterium]|jgi:hypothetical protein
MPSEREKSMKRDCDQFLADLICTADEAAERDAAQVALGLDSRVLSRIREDSAGEQLLERWANGFLRAALISAAAVIVMAATAWFTTDLISVGDDLAFSGIAENGSQFELWSSN